MNYLKLLTFQNIDIFIQWYNLLTNDHGYSIYKLTQEFE